MKKEYKKPDVKVVQLQHQTMLLADSNVLTGVSTTGLATEDDLDIDDEEAGNDFWGR